MPTFIRCAALVDLGSKQTSDAAQHQLSTVIRRILH